jgi:hypothetical protein
MTNRPIAVVLSIMLMAVCLSSQVPLSTAAAAPRIYKTGTKFVLDASWWGLSASGTMEVLENTKFRGKDVILVRSQMTKLGGLLGFIVKFLRVYRGSNTFDSYIDPDTFMTVKYENYKLNKDGVKKLNEHIYFDRELNRVVSLQHNKTMVSDVAPDIQDTFSAFLQLICRFNTEELFVGKKFSVDIYGYEEAFEVEIEVTHWKLRNGKAVYTLEIERLPAVFKHPAFVSFEVTDVEDGFRLPTRGKCTIDVPVLTSVTVKGDLRQVRPGS